MTRKKYSAHLLLEQLDASAQASESRPSAEAALGLPRPPLLPTPEIVLAGDRWPERALRQERLQEIHGRKSELLELSEERKLPAHLRPSMADLTTRALHLVSEIDMLEDAYRKDFVPVFSPKQLLNNRQLLRSKLFNVRGKGTPRGELITIEIGQDEAAAVYHGPELRQSDALVFMGLVNMARDVRVGVQVTFDPSEVCRWLFGYYDGDMRRRLQECIYRLQHAVLQFKTFSVQLAQRFHYPQRGRWSVMLDPDIVYLFTSNEERVWLDLALRRAIPDGLASWLYSYIESQTKLIPTPAELLREQSGSDARPGRPFEIVLRRALNSLADWGVLDPGWSLKKATVHWRKAASGPGVQASGTLALLSRPAA